MAEPPRPPGGRKRDKLKGILHRATGVFKKKTKQPAVEETTGSAGSGHQSNPLPPSSLADLGHQSNPFSSPSADLGHQSKILPMGSDLRKTVCPMSTHPERGEQNLENKISPAESSLPPKEIVADRFERQETIAPTSKPADKISAPGEGGSVHPLGTTETSAGLGSSNRKLGLQKRLSSADSDGEDEASKQTAFLKGREIWRNEIIQGRYHARQDTGWEAPLPKGKKRLGYNDSGPATLQYD